MLLVKAVEPEWKQLHRIADGLRPELQRELFAALDALKKQIPTASLVVLIENGELTRVLAETKLTLPDLTALTAAMTGVVVASAKHATATLEMSFTLVNQRAVTWAERFAGQLITEVDQATQKAVSEIVQRGFLEGMAPRVQAIAIEQAVGNHPRDAQATFRFLDGLVQSGMSEKRASELSATYARRLLRNRAEMIARTETMRASNMGQQLAWEAATDQGLLLPGEVEKIWIVTDDDRTCARCLSMEEEVNGKPRGQVALGDGFNEGAVTAPKGVAVETRTPPLHPMCRCAMGLVEILQAEEVFEPTPPDDRISDPTSPPEHWNRGDTLEVEGWWDGSKTAPWDMTEREMIVDTPPGVKVGGYRGTFWASNEPSKIKVNTNNGFFGSTPAHRREIIMHEIGHDLDAFLTSTPEKVNRSFDLWQDTTGPFHNASGNPFNGHSSMIEAIADAYSALWEPDVYQRAGELGYQRLLDLAEAEALAAGMPLPKSLGGRIGKGVAKAKSWVCGGRADSSFSSGGKIRFHP